LYFVVSKLTFAKIDLSGFWLVKHTE